MTTQNMRASVSSSRVFTSALQYVVAIFFSLVVLVPLMATVLNGFKTNGEVLRYPFGLPTIWHWENYVDVMQTPSFQRQLGNSTMVMLASAFGVVLLSSMPAFVF